MSLQYLEIDARDEVNFLEVDNHQSFLQGDTIILDEHDPPFTKYSK